MSALIISILEIIVVCFTVWCLFHEKALVQLEKRIMRNIRRRKLKVIKGGKNLNKYYA